MALVPVISVSGKPCLNTHKGKKSYMILLSDTAGTFSGITTVTAADSTNSFNWIGQEHDVHDNGKRLQLKMFTSNGTFDATDAKKHKKDDDEAAPPVDTGTVTVTVTNPAASVPNVPVDYIDDGTS
jgi:hypothetical protein